MVISHQKKKIKNLFDFEGKQENSKHFLQLPIQDNSLDLPKKYFKLFAISKNVTIISVNNSPNKKNQLNFFLPHFLLLFFFSHYI